MIIILGTYIDTYSLLGVITIVNIVVILLITIILT